MKMLKQKYITLVNVFAFVVALRHRLAGTL